MAIARRIRERRVVETLPRAGILAASSCPHPWSVNMWQDRQSPHTEASITFIFPPTIATTSLKGNLGLQLVNTQRDEASESLREHLTRQVSREQESIVLSKVNISFPT